MLYSSSRQAVRLQTCPVLLANIYHIYTLSSQISEKSPKCIEVTVGLPIAFTQ